MLKYSLAKDGSVTRSALAVTRLKLGDLLGLSHRRGHGGGRENKCGAGEYLGELHLENWKCMRWMNVAPSEIYGPLLIPFISSPVDVSARSGEQGSEKLEPFYPEHSSASKSDFTCACGHPADLIRANC